MKTGSALLVAGGIAAASGLLLWGVLPREQESKPGTWQTYAGTYTEADVEAGARMLASENPRGSRRLHIEQLFTQLRSRKPGESLFDRITAGSGWGEQGESKKPGGVRPVATGELATEAFRDLVREVLDGVHASEYPRARKWFEPAQSDLAVAIGNRARAKLAEGIAMKDLTKQERRLLNYKKTAAQVRAQWLAKGAKLIASFEGIEFYS